MTTVLNSKGLEQDRDCGMCPSCGSVNGWYRAGRVSSSALLVARINKTLAKVELSIQGGHCLACGHEQPAIYNKEAAG